MGLLIIYYCLFFILLTLSKNSIVEGNANQSVVRLQEYLRINTAHPHPDYESAINWIRQQSVELNLQFEKWSLESGNINGSFAIVLTWYGSKPFLPSIFLYSHMDVVGVNKENWKFDPFSGHIDEDGNIYGRGAQDMKSIGVAYLEAIRSLRARKTFVPTRTIRIVFLPNEEQGGVNGILVFTNTSEFASLNVGFALDEGLPNENGILNLYYTERRMLWVKITGRGESGHGSLLLHNTAGVKLMRVVNKLLALREHEEWRLKADKSLSLGDVTTVNLNKLSGGNAVNIIPSSLTVTFDIRVTPHWDFVEFEKYLNETISEEGVSYEYLAATRQDTINPITQLNTNSWWWNALNNSFKKLDIETRSRIMPGGTDGIALRRLGIPVIGISPIFNTSISMHGDNEFISSENFIRMINIYQVIIENLSKIASKHDHSHNERITTTKKPNSSGQHGGLTTKKPGSGGSSLKLAATSILIFHLILLF